MYSEFFFIYIFISINNLSKFICTVQLKRYCPVKRWYNKNKRGYKTAYFISTSDINDRTDIRQENGISSCIGLRVG